MKGKAPVRTYFVDSDDAISISDEPDDPKDLQDGRERFRSRKELAELAKRWPAKRLVRIWNRLPGQESVKRFAGRDAGAAAIWDVIGTSANPRAVMDSVRAQRPKHSKDLTLARSNPVTVKDTILALLCSRTGATIRQLQEATEWQEHSLRGYISGTLKKKMGLKIQSSKAGSRGRVYRILEKAEKP
jgi:hypothetical protein